MEPVILIHTCSCTQWICLIVLGSFCQSAPIVDKIVLEKCTFCQILKALLPQASSLCQLGIWVPEFRSPHWQSCHNTYEHNLRVFCVCVCMCFSLVCFFLYFFLIFFFWGGEECCFVFFFILHSGLVCWFGFACLSIYSFFP